MNARSTAICFSWLSLLCSLLFPPASGASDSIDEICRSNYLRCLEVLPAQLESTDSSTERWYSLKLFEMDANFNLVRFDDLDRVLEQMLIIDDLPVRVRLRVYFYKAKVHTFLQQEVEGERFKRKAGRLLTELAKETRHPRAIIDYANFQMYLGNYPDGIRTLKMLEFNLRNLDDPDIKESLYTNLANLHIYNGMEQEALPYYRLANEYAGQTSNLYHQVMTRYNLARGNQFVGNVDRALKLFAEALEMATQHKDDIHVSLSHLRLGQLLLERGDLVQARAHLQKVDASIHSSKTLELLQQLLEKAAAN